MRPRQKGKDNHVAANSDSVTRGDKAGGFHLERLLRRRPNPAVTAASLALVAASVVLILAGITANAISKQAIDLTRAFYPLIGLGVLSFLCGVLLFSFGTSWKRGIFELMNWEKQFLEMGAIFVGAARARTAMESHPELDSQKGSKPR